MRDSMIIYTAYAEKFNRLSDAQFGQLMRIAISYQKDGVVPEVVDTSVGLAFDVIRHDLDENNRKYAEVVEKRRQAGKQGAEIRWQGMANDGKNSKCQQMIANDSKAWQDIAKIADNDNDNVNDNVINNKEKSIKEKPKRDRFVPPTESQLLEYCIEANLNIDTSAFIDFYSSKGWKVGSQSMKDWKAAARNWARRDRDKKPKSNLGLFGDYKQTSKDEEWDDFSRLASGGKS